GRIRDSHRGSGPDRGGEDRRSGGVSANRRTVSGGGLQPGLPHARDARGGGGCGAGDLCPYLSPAGSLRHGTQVLDLDPGDRHQLLHRSVAAATDAVRAAAEHHPLGQGARERAGGRSAQQRIARRDATPAEAAAGEVSRTVGAALLGRIVVRRDRGDPRRARRDDQDTDPPGAQAAREDAGRGGGKAGCAVESV
ncbi:MAG: RNA polymerase sigma factor SigW, partial [uncultured Thermomicrobiales bacterium]